MAREKIWTKTLVHMFSAKKLPFPIFGANFDVFGSIMIKLYQKPHVFINILMKDITFGHRDSSSLE
jgi:hypothetical protein